MPYHRDSSLRIHELTMYAWDRSTHLSMHAYNPIYISTSTSIIASGLGANYFLDLEFG